MNSSTSPSVGYSYADGSQGHIRPTALVYPNGRVLSYGYNSGSDDMANRVSFLADGSAIPPMAGERLDQQLVNYQYLGLSSIIDVTYPQPKIRCTYDVDPTVPRTYPGLDRFGQVVVLLWQRTDTLTVLERVHHGYDRAGNRLWRRCPVASAGGQAFDELYAYDGANQLRALTRGRLNDTMTGVVDRNFAESWDLDATGNWSGYRKDSHGGGSWDESQIRQHNPANEITGIYDTAGDRWISPTHDRAGNMLRLPQPRDPEKALVCVYDAWNRLVRVADGTDIVAEYQYDGRNFRIVKKTFAAGRRAHSRHYYYNGGWQLLEERTEQSPAPNPQSVIPSSQYVWGLRYIDDLVLRDRDATGLGQPSERLYALQDPNWNVTAIADPTGAIHERYQYTAYGVRSVLGAAFGPISATNYDLWYAFTGRPLDVATGLYDYRGRPYGAGVGRFFVRDPIGYSGGDDNVYRFCGGNPVIHVDPNGTDIYLINFVHQQICVDAWDRDERGCWHQRHEPICFSFHAISFMPQWYGLSQTWLGWTMWPPILPMLDLPGEIYRDTPQFGMRLATLRTGDPQRDVNWANYMAYQRVRLGDRYNLQWLDCIHYTNNEYGDAPLHW